MATKPRRVAHTVADLTGIVAGILGGSRRVATPDAEARELVAALLDKPRHWTVLRGADAVDDDVLVRARAAARRRAAGAPLAYAVGQVNFRHLTLSVDERVLVPRPETELLVDLVLARRATGVLADVGTGSGALAIALATEGRFDRVIGTDVSGDALAVARANAAACGATVEFLQGNLLDAVDGQVSVVVSNPPYIAFHEAGALPASVRDWEPPVALYSPGAGLSLTARLARQAAARLEGGGLLALEVDSRRGALVAELLASDNRWDDVTVHLDLAGRERFVLAIRRKGE